MKAPEKGCWHKPFMKSKKPPSAASPAMFVSPELLATFATLVLGAAGLGTMTVGSGVGGGVGTSVGSGVGGTGVGLGVGSGVGMGVGNAQGVWFSQ